MGWLQCCTSSGNACVWREVTSLCVLAIRLAVAVDCLALRTPSGLREKEEDSSLIFVELFFRQWSNFVELFTKSSLWPNTEFWQFSRKLLKMRNYFASYETLGTVALLPRFSAIEIRDRVLKCWQVLLCCDRTWVVLPVRRVEHWMHYLWVVHRTHHVPGLFVLAARSLYAKYAWTWQALY